MPSKNVLAWRPLLGKYEEVGPTLGWLSFGIGLSVLIARRTNNRF